MTTNGITQSVSQADTPAAAEVPTAPRRSRGPLSFLSSRAVELLLIAVLVTGAVSSPNFLTTFNLQGLLSQAAILGFLAIGQYAVIVAGGFDLSVGAVAALASMVVASLLDDSIVVAIVAAIGSGAAMGLVSGLSVTWGRVPPIVATLGVMGIAQGLAFSISNRGIVITDPSFMKINTTSFGFVPLVMVIWVVVTILIYGLMHYTRTGTYLFAIGGNAGSARLAGVPVVRTKIIAFVLSGTMAGAAGVLFASRASSGLPGLGVGWELDTIAAVVIGGVSLYGGSGNVIRAMLGVLTYLTVTNIMNLGNVDPYLQNVLKGALILAAVAIPLLLQRKNRLHGRTA